MNRNLIFLPVLLQVLLTLYAYILLGRAKSRATRASLVNDARRALHADAWPDAVIQINNNIRNQFELPVLFYVLVVVLWAVDAAGTPALAVAWLFALSRVAHLYVHTGSNYVPLRRKVFTFGVIMIIVLVVIVALRVVSGLPVTAQ